MKRYRIEVLWQEEDKLRPETFLEDDVIGMVDFFFDHMETSEDLVSIEMWDGDTRLAYKKRRGGEEHEEIYRSGGQGSRQDVS